MLPINTLCDRVREIAYAIHVWHGPGHLEKIYENALAHRLRKAGFKVETQHPIVVKDEDGMPLGHYFADLFVDDRLIIEVKATAAIAPEHVAQVLGYLKSTGIRDGLLTNFGAGKFAIRKFVFGLNPSDSSSGDF